MKAADHDAEDRIFLYSSVADEATREREFEALATAGHPVLCWDIWISDSAV